MISALACNGLAVKPMTVSSSQPRSTAILKTSSVRHSKIVRSISSKVVCRSSSATAVVESAVQADGSVYDVVVVGAGISGLVTAQAFETKHANTVKSFLVTEARERVGGNITSRGDDTFRWEEGPNSFQPSDSVLEAAVCSQMSR